MTVRNKDPADLARRATVTATSEMRYGATRVAGYMPLDVPRGVQLWDWAPALEEAHFYVRNGTDREQRLALTLSLFQAEVPWKDPRDQIPFAHIQTRANRMEWGSDNRMDRFEPVASAKTIIPARFEGWLPFRFPEPVHMIPVDPTSDENRYNLLLNACPGVELAVDDHHYDFALRTWAPPDGGRGLVDGDCHAFQIAPAPPYGEAANAIDGHHRRYATNPLHAWLPAFDAPLPQAITLTFPAPAEVSSVQLTFDTIERAYRDAPINCDERYARRCVTDYRVEVRTEEEWQEVVEERDNYQRWRVHAFGPVVTSAVRLTVLKVRDPRYRARVYEARIY